jgi:mono/diheme cytochrome c family protein
LPSEAQRTPRKSIWVGAVVVGLTLVALVLAWHSTQPTQTSLRADDAATVARGQAIYSTHCAACHGAKLEGQPRWREPDAQGRLPAPPHDASGHTWHHTDEQLFRLTKYGIAVAANLPGRDSAMPRYEGVLSDEEIIAVLSFIKAEWPAETRTRHDALNRAAAAR